MRIKNISLSLVVLGCLGGFVLSCYQQPGKGPQKAPAVGIALKAPGDAENKAAARKNDEGLSHLVQEHWEKSNQFFREAINEDPNLAVAHFNLGLSLDELGQHPEASEHFRKAKELAPDDARISENEILLKHL